MSRSNGITGGAANLTSVCLAGLFQPSIMVAHFSVGSRTDQFVINVTSSGPAQLEAKEDLPRSREE